MDTTNRFGPFQLSAWLGLSHLAAAVVAAGVVYLAPFGWPPAGQLLAGMLLGLAAGLLLSLPLRRAVEIAAAALAQLSRGQIIAPLPLDWQRRWGPLGDLLSRVDALGARERELAHLREDLVRSTGQAAAQAERNRLARDLHDSIKQQLYAINVSAAAALARWESDLAGARVAVEDVRRAAQAALAEMAALLQQLRPAPLAAAGLLDALREQCEALAHRTDAVVAVDLGQPADAAAYAAAVDDQRLAPGAEEAIFRIAQEALNNVARHARAGHVTLRLRVDGDTLRLEIADDGQGFAMVETGAAGGNGRPVAGYGLAGMRDRADAIGAVLDVASAPASGTRVTLTVPLGQPAAQQEVIMNAEVKQLARAGSAMHWLALAAGGLAGVFALGLIPRLAGGSLAPAPLSVTLGLILISTVVAMVAWSRARRSMLSLTLRLGMDHPQVWRLRREAHNRRMWVCLVGVFLLPAALIPQAWPQYPVAALAIGLLCASLAGLQIGRTYKVTEAYWRSLSSLALRAELDQAWSQRFAPLMVLAVTIPGYLFLRFGGAPVPLAWPPSRELVIDILATVYLNLLLIWSVVTYAQVRHWRGAGAQPAQGA